MTSRTSLADCPIGVVPIVWNNVDLAGAAEPYAADFVLDEIARLGFSGCQYGLGFPEGAALIDELRSRGLRLAEVYAAVTCTEDGPVPGSLDAVKERLELLKQSDGEMLVVALDISPQRSSFAGRSTHPDCPRLTDDGWRQLEALLAEVTAAVSDSGGLASFHPHVGTFVENPDETERLAATISSTDMGLCLDVGHYALGGGEPASAIAEYGELVTHVHLKDVDPSVKSDLAAGVLESFEDALNNRVFTELGSGLLDLPAVVEALGRINYRGWLMIEQDTSWLSPSEASAVGLRVARYAIDQLN